VKLIVTGGAGFIGSAAVRLAVSAGHDVVVFDKLTYAGHRSNLAAVESSPRFQFVLGDVANPTDAGATLDRHRPDAVMHLAAESHVDRSIDGPRTAVETNVMGTFTILEAARSYWQSLPVDRRQRFRFHHVSTDEVFGSLGSVGQFDEGTRYDPRSPYSASKAASDHLVRAWHHTYGLPVVISNTCNNYGPYQYPEKLIPVLVRRAVEGKSLPIYGSGTNVRDWIHVDDHARALLEILTRGRIGESYNVGARVERTNLEIAHLVCATLDDLLPRSRYRPHAQLIEFVTDRPGHDQRYAIDPAKVERELGWRPRIGFEDGLRASVQWYVEHEGWCRQVLAGRPAGERIGLSGVR
jgi:dTDP-glucose 4,6-dehydratase